MKPLLIVLDDWEGRIQSSSCWANLKDQVDIKFLKGPLEEQDNEVFPHTQFLMAIRERTTLNEALFQRMPQLKLILQTGGHSYHIDAAAARKRNIIIALGRRVKAPLMSVPELTFAFMLSLTHKVYLGNSSMQHGKWELFTGCTLSERRLGILGLGRHGSRVANIARTAFNMDVVAWDRTGNYQNKQEIQRLTLNELLETSDVVSIHLKLSKESMGLLDKVRLAKMKKSAILINTSRGAIVDEDALTDALRNGNIAGAGLDVFTHEPLPPDSSLRKLDNVVLTPHIGWTVEEVFEEFARIACAQLRDYLNDTLADSELLQD